MVIHPYDIEFSCFIAWSLELQRLYFAIEVLDDMYTRPNASDQDEEPYASDSLGLIVDGDHSGGEYFYDRFEPPDEWTINAMSNVPAQHYYLSPPSPHGTSIAIYNDSQGAASRPPYADVGGGVEASTWGSNLVLPRTKYLVEGYVTPWDSLALDDPGSSRRSALSVGAIIGIQIVVVDCDNEIYGCHGFYTIAGAGNFWKDADTFTDVELAPHARETAILSHSWARVKASLR